MIVQNFQKFHNKQVVQIGTHQTDWILHFQIQPHRVSEHEQSAK